jgi:acetylornithine aminotransferase
MVGIELDRPCSELVQLALANENLLISVTRDRTIRLLPALICTDAEIDQIVIRTGRLVRQWAHALVGLSAVNT